MGYTHYWYRNKEIKKEVFEAIVNDFKQMIPVLDALKVKLADGCGKGYPEITSDLVCFNGKSDCGHKKNEMVSIPWPSPNAKGVGQSDNQICIDGQWFAGATLNARCCNGDCSYETFDFPRKIEPSEYQQPQKEISHYMGGKPVYNNKNVIGKYFNCTKTAYRPYDLAVNMFLIVAKHHLKDEIVVSSDGEIKHWLDAMQLCQGILNYGLDFRLLRE